MRKNGEGGSGMCTAMREWLADERNAGIKEGKTEGRKEGEKRFASLASALMVSKRLDDLNEAVSNEAFRDSLYQEFGL